MRKWPTFYHLEKICSKTVVVHLQFDYRSLLVPKKHRSALGTKDRKQQHQFYLENGISKQIMLQS